MSDSYCNIPVLLEEWASTGHKGFTALDTKCMNEGRTSFVKRSKQTFNRKQQSSTGEDSSTFWFLFFLFFFLIFCIVWRVQRTVWGMKVTAMSSLFQLAVGGEGLRFWSTEVWLDQIFLTYMTFQNLSITSPLPTGSRPSTLFLNI